MSIVCFGVYLLLICWPSDGLSNWIKAGAQNSANSAAIQQKTTEFLKRNTEKLSQIT